MTGDRDERNTCKVWIGRGHARNPQTQLSTFREGMQRRLGVLQRGWGIDAELRTARRCRAMYSRRSMIWWTVVAGAGACDRCSWTLEYVEVADAGTSSGSAGSGGDTRVGTGGEGTGAVSGSGDAGSTGAVGEGGEGEGGGSEDGASSGDGATDTGGAGSSSSSSSSGAEAPAVSPVRRTPESHSACI